MKRVLAALLWFGFLGASGWAQAVDTPLTQALGTDSVQASYLARHPEILRWVGKHPDLTLRLADGGSVGDEAPKAPAIRAWITENPALARLVAAEPALALAWADDPRDLNDLPKRTKR